MGFDNPIVGGTALRIPAIQSPNYAAGLLGWIIQQNGNAEFNNLTVRGEFLGSQFILNSAGLFLYSATPAAGNLIASIAPVSGTDSFGNAYGRGLMVYNPSAGSAVQVDAGAGASNVIFDPPDVTGVTWANGTVAVGTGTRLGTNTPVLSLSSPYNTSPSASQSSISLFGRPETASGSTTNEIFMSTQRVWVTGDANVAGTLTAGNQDEGTVTASLSAAASVDVTVTFSKTFTAVPKVVATLSNTGTLPAGSTALTCRVHSKSTTGCTIRVSDVGAVARTLNIDVDWHARTS